MAPELKFGFEWDQPHLQNRFEKGQKDYLVSAFQD